MPWQQLPQVAQILQLTLANLLLLLAILGLIMLQVGMARNQNAVTIITKNVGALALAAIVFLFFGCHIINSEAGSYMPHISFAFLGFGNDSGFKTTLEILSNLYNLLLSFIPLTIVAAAVMERMKLYAFLTFTIVFAALIYPLISFWSGAAGFIGELGFINTVKAAEVHLAGAMAAVAAVIVLGPRKNRYGKKSVKAPFPGSNLPLAAVGAMLALIGFIGVNTGGVNLIVADVELSLQHVAQVSFNTIVVALIAALTAMLITRIMRGKTDLTLMLNSLIAGAAAVTVIPTNHSIAAAFLLGLGTAVVVVMSVALFDKLQFDDPAGFVSQQGVIVLLVLLLLPLLQPQAHFKAQFIGVTLISLWSFAISFIAWRLIKVVYGVRTPSAIEIRGLDFDECGMEAYPEFLKN